MCSVHECPEDLLAQYGHHKEHHRADGNKDPGEAGGAVKKRRAQDGNVSGGTSSQGAPGGTARAKKDVEVRQPELVDDHRPDNGRKEQQAKIVRGINFPVQKGNQAGSKTDVCSYGESEQRQKKRGEPHEKAEVV